MNANRSRGFSLIEMMISITILAIMMLGALPSFGAWIQKMRTRGTAESILNAMQLGRAEAVRRNSDILVVLSNTAWAVFVVRTGEMIQARTTGEGAGTTAVSIAPAGASAVTFNSLGRVTPNLDGTSSVSQVTVSSTALPESERRDLRTDIGLGGNVRMCDLQVPAGDPRACL